MLTLPSEDLPISHTSNHHTLHTLSTESLVSHLCAPTRYVSTNATSDHSSASDTQQTSFIEPNDDEKNKARTSICDAPQRIVWRFGFPLESRLAAHQRCTQRSPRHKARKGSRDSTNPPGPTSASCAIEIYPVGKQLENKTPCYSTYTIGHYCHS